ncbi:MAG: hypothetical protein ACT4QC_12175 [Planctomycetaceae bacterium]
MSVSPNFAGSWVHFVETVYGASLHGDPRGFRTRQHREHVEGDYKSPPPTGLYDKKLRRSRASLKQPAVILPPPWRQIIGAAVRDRLQDLGGFVLCLAQGGQHLHLLAKLPAGDDSRNLMGLAKKHSAFEAKARGWKGKLWGKRGKEVRVRNRAHQLNVYRYILEHAQEGAWVWSREHQ